MKWICANGETQQVALTAQRSKTRENFIRMFFFIVPGLLVPSRHYFWQRRRSQYGLPTRFATTLKGTERQSTICSKSSLHIIILKPFTLECLRASIAIILVYSQLSANPSMEVTLVVLLCWRVSHQQY